MSASGAHVPPCDHPACTVLRTERHRTDRDRAKSRHLSLVWNGVIVHYASNGRCSGGRCRLAPCTRGRQPSRRCGVNSCAGSDADPIVKLDPDGNVVQSFGAGLILWPHGMDVDSEGNVWVVGSSTVNS